MTGRRRDVTDAELAVLRVLWRDLATTIRDITAEVYPDGVRTQYSTVKRLLARLETKGYVKRDRSEFVHVFSPVVARDELVGRRLEALADSLCNGAIAPLLTCLAKSDRLTEEQQEALLSLVSELAGPAQGKIEATRNLKRSMAAITLSDREIPDVNRIQPEHEQCHQ